MAADNKSLGKFVLDGIPAAPRGVPQIEVTFDINANGIINVTAMDKATSRSQHITITASSGLDENEIERMRKEAELHGEEDNRRKEIAEARNHADNLIYQSEKMLRENGEKIDAEKKQEVETKIASLRGIINGEDVENMRKQIGELRPINSANWCQYVSTTRCSRRANRAEPGSTDSTNQKPDGDDVVDGEFKSV